MNLWANRVCYYKSEKSATLVTFLQLIIMLLGLLFKDMHSAFCCLTKLCRILLERKADLIGHILRRNCLLNHIIAGKIEGTGRRKIRRKQLLDNLMEIERGTVWRTCFGRGYSPVVRQTTWWRLSDVRSIFYMSLQAYLPVVILRNWWLLTFYSVDGRKTAKWLVGKDLEANRYGIFDSLPRFFFFERLRKTMKNLDRVQTRFEPDT